MIGASYGLLRDAQGYLEKRLLAEDTEEVKSPGESVAVEEARSEIDDMSATELLLAQAEQTIADSEALLKKIEKRRLERHSESE